MKELPKPTYYVRVENKSVKDLEAGRKLIKELQELGIDADVKPTIYLSCFGCRAFKEKCKYELWNDICPIGRAGA